MALLKTLLEKLIAELSRATPDEKAKLRSALGEENVPEPEQAAEPESTVENNEAEAETAEDEKGEESAENEVASEETAEDEKTPEETATPEETENAEPTEAKQEPEQEPAEGNGQAAEEIAEEAPAEEEIPKMRKDVISEEEDIPMDYEQIIDGLNAKILALQAENERLRAKTEGAFGYSSKIGEGVRRNMLYDDCKDLRMHK